MKKYHRVFSEQLDSGMINHALVMRARGLVEAAGTNFLWNPHSHQTVAMMLEEWAAATPADPFLVFEGHQWSIGQLNTEINRHAWAYHGLGLRKGDVVALFMDNRPAFIIHFYALLKLGVVASLINTNLRGKILARSIAACQPNLIVVSATLASAVAEIRSELGKAEIWCDIEESGHFPAGFRDFSSLTERSRSGSPPGSRSHRLTDLAAYVYTSGTTGLPKIAVVKHHRLYRAGKIFGGMLSLGRSDCVYLCLPLYHGNGSLIGVPMAITHRCKLALARKFSARRFWSDCRETGATTFVYVGELCRYLMQTEKTPDEKNHQVNRAIGNGLRKDVWQRFRERFGIDRIHEFYASTEGNAETVNIFGSEGCCGLLFPWKMALLRYDFETDAPVRTANGLCIPVEAEEPGLLVGKIGGRNEYAGYSDTQASQKKVIRDVFKPGDVWFNSGDILRRDKLYRLSFVDRIGDTFRWKGENVSTQEVSEVLHCAEGVCEANVYGVKVPGQEGRVGMAALVIDSTFDAKVFYHHVAAQLPNYAQPRFLRIVQAMALTGSLRQQKFELKSQGYSAELEDPLLLRDPERETYVELNEDRRREINKGCWAL